MNWRNASFAAAGALALTALLGWGMTRDPAEIPSPLPGKPAPGFALQRLDNRTEQINLQDLRGEIVVLNFWASWCLNCRAEHSTLSAVATRYEGRGVHFYGVIYDDSPANAEAWMTEMGGQSYPALIDNGSQTAIDYGLYGVPETFFIGPDGKVAFKQIGPATEQILTKWIDKLLLERKVAGK